MKGGIAGNRPGPACPGAACPPAAGPLAGGPPACRAQSIGLGSPAAGPAGGANNGQSRSSSRWATARSAQTCRRASRSLSSAAGSRPRWREGRSRDACWGSTPNSGTSIAARASASKARWRSLPTRLRTTPASSTRGGPWSRNPRTSAAREPACREASTTSTTGRSSRTASSAELPAVLGPRPSNSPITPSTRARSARLPCQAKLRRTHSGLQSKLSRLRQGWPLTRLSSWGSR